MGTIPGVILGALFLRLVVDAVQKLAVTNADRIEGLVVGMLVVLAVALNTVRLGSGQRKEFFPGWLGLLNVFILSLLAGLLYGVTAIKHPLYSGVVVGSVCFVVLALRAGWERFPLRLSRSVDPVA